MKVMMKDALRVELHDSRAEPRQRLHNARSRRGANHHQQRFQHAKPSPSSQFHPHRCKRKPMYIGHIRAKPLRSCQSVLRLYFSRKQLFRLSYYVNMKKTQGLRL